MQPVDAVAVISCGPSTPSAFLGHIMAQEISLA